MGRDVGGKRFSDFELRNRPTEGTQTRMTVEQYRQRAESLPEKKSDGSMGTLTVSYTHLDRPQYGG